MARQADAPVLAALHRACFTDAWDAAAFAKLLANPAVFAVVAAVSVDANESQGFVVIQTAGGESEILALGVAPAARRAGLARDLLGRARMEAAKRGAQSMFLEVAEDNGAALALYRGAGFVIVGRRKAYYARPGGKAVDALMLRASLPG
jgi:ribosomal-protein-alanine N-acetyltransferase